MTLHIGRKKPKNLKAVRTIGKPAGIVKLKKPKAPTLKQLSIRPEPLGHASADRVLCAKCGLCQHTSSPFVTPWIPEGWTGKLLLVGPPPVESHDYIRPLRASVGKLLRGIASRCGFNERDVGFISATRCSAESPTMDQIRCCRPFLLYAIRKLKPQGLLTLGKYAMKAVANNNGQNITKARGKQLGVPGV